MGCQQGLQHLLTWLYSTVIMLYECWSLPAHVGELPGGLASLSVLEQRSKSATSTEKIAVRSWEECDPPMQNSQQTSFLLPAGSKM
jgi:hypothetical protein